MMNVPNLNSENLIVDWFSFNLAGLMNPIIIANRLAKHFTPHLLIDNIPAIESSFPKREYKVYIRQYTGSIGYWVGTQIIFSGKDAAYFYKVIKTEKFDWNLLKFDGHKLSLGRIDLCFSRPNGSSHTTKLFDEFLLNSRSQIKNYTNTRHIRLQDFPDGKILKVNRRNNSVHYRVYQKN